MAMKKLWAKKKFNKTNISDIPNQSGIYVATNKKWETLYVGKAWWGRLQDRLQEHLNEKDIRWIENIQIRTTSSSQEALKIEKSYIKRLNPKLNIIHNS